MECFKAPYCATFNEKYAIDGNVFILGNELKNLFPYVWNPIDAFNAFTGYSANQRTKMVRYDTPKDRVAKYACAYLRTLYNLECLLSCGTFQLDVTHYPSFHKRLMNIREGDFTIGDVIDEANERVEYCKKLRDMCKHKPDHDKVNNFLIKVRKEYFNAL